MLLRKTIRRTAVTAVLLASAGGPALAGDGFYVGATAGRSFFHENQGEADAAITEAFNESGFTVFSGSSSLDKSDFAFGGLVGYQFLPGFSLEAAYVDLGKLNYKSNAMVTNGFVTLPAAANLTAKAKGPTLSALGGLPLSPAWEVYGRAGLFFSKVTLTADLNVNGVTGSASESANSVNGLFGVGTAWHVAKNVALRAEYTRFVNVGDKDKTGQTNIDLVNVGVTYSFR